MKITSHSFSLMFSSKFEYLKVIICNFYICRLTFFTGGRFSTVVVPRNIKWTHLRYICSACRWRPSLRSCTSLKRRRIMPSALSKSLSTSTVCCAGFPAFRRRISCNNSDEESYYNRSQRLHGNFIVHGQICMHFEDSAEYALTVCSRDSVWLICSSHMPDSICTFLTICWRRSNLEMIRICIQIITF